LDVEVYGVRLPRFGQKTPEILQNVVDKIPKEADLIHVQYEYGLYQQFADPFYGMLKAVGKPIVTTMHAVGNYKIDATISSKSDKVITHNKFCSKRFSYPNVIIPHGVLPVKCPDKDECKKSFGIDKKIPVVGYLGFISEYKGLEILISAMTKVPNAALLICGGWHVDEQTQYIWDLKETTLKVLPGRCQWTDFIPDDQLPVAYGAMGVMVYPSRFATESGALLTAIGHGKAIISSDLPPFKEKEEVGALLTFDSTERLVEKIKLLLMNEAERRRLEEGAMKYAEATSWSVVAKQHIKLYEEVLASVEKPVDNPVSPTQ
jgi:glycosyltransferase involved in cell wall biosynthesis